MKMPTFLENIFYVKPFQMKSEEVFRNNLSLVYAASDDDKNFIFILCINNKLLEFSKKYHESLKIKEFQLSVQGLKDWTDKVNKIKQMKDNGTICLPNETIENISNYIRNHKKYIELNMDDIRLIYKTCIHFERDFYKANSIDVNVKMDGGLQNHWLD